MARRVRARRPRLHPATDRQLAALRDHAARRRQESAAENYRRLAAAIEEIEGKDDPATYPVSVKTIRDVSGLEYMSYARYPRALALFRMHSTRLKRRRTGRTGQPGDGEGTASPARDRLLNYTKATLVARLRSLMEERDDGQRRMAALLAACMERDRRILDLEATVAALTPYKEIATQLERLRIRAREEEHDG